MNTVGNTSLDAYFGPPQKINGIDVYTIDRLKIEPPPQGFDRDSFQLHRRESGPHTHLSSIQTVKDIFSMVVV